jgi:hypothetical protein
VYCKRHGGPPNLVVNLDFAQFCREFSLQEDCFVSRPRVILIVRACSPKLSDDHPEIQSMDHGSRDAEADALSAGVMHCSCYPDVVDINRLIKRGQI